MYQTANAPGTGFSAGQEAKPIKQTQMQEHASSIHEQAGRLHDLVGRLSGILDRMVGPTPESPNNPAPQPEPSGALLVAQFGVERIRLGNERLTDLVGRLSNIA